MKKAFKLSPSNLDTLPEGKHFDALTPGLCVTVSASGKKTWLFRRRVSRSGAIATLTLGTFPAYAIAAARQWASGLNEMVERGEDPRVVLRAQQTRDELSVGKAHGQYMDAMRRGERKKLEPRTLYDKSVIYSRDIGPRLGSKSLLELTEDECWDAV